MKKLDQKFYGNIYKAKDNSLVDPEQSIVFLAQDDAFFRAIQDYPKYCEEAGSDIRHLQAAEQLIHDMEMWRNANPDKCHPPGMTLDEKIYDDLSVGEIPSGPKFAEETEKDKEQIRILIAQVEEQAQRIADLEEEQNQVLAEIKEKKEREEAANQQNNGDD